jgi:hypothetical protein
LSVIVSVGPPVVGGIAVAAGGQAMFRRLAVG